MNDKIVSYRDVGRILNRDPKTIKQWVSKRKIPAVYLKGSKNALGLRESTVKSILENEIGSSGSSAIAKRKGATK